MKAFITHYADIFSKLTYKHANYIIEAIFESKSFDMRKWKDNQTKKQLSLVFPTWKNYVNKTFSEELIDYKLQPTFEENPMFIKRTLTLAQKSYTVYCPKIDENLTEEFILNNVFNKHLNNNQLATTKNYIPITKDSYEMYASSINHNTENYAAFLPYMSNIGQTAETLTNYLLTLDGPINVFINPPFNEKIIRQAIKYTKPLLNRPQTKIQFTVPVWSKADYEKDGIYAWLVENLELKHQGPEVFINKFSGQRVSIEVSVFVKE